MSKPSSHDGSRTTAYGSPDAAPTALAAEVASEAAAAGGQGADAPRVGQNIGVLAGAQLITWTMTLLWTLVVPRALGPSGMGTLLAAWAVVAIFGLVLGLGTRNYLVRESVVDRSEAPRLIGTAIVLRIALSPLLIGAAVVYGEVAGWEHEAKMVLYLAAAATILVQLAEPMQAAFQATERMEYIAYSEIISKSAQGLVGIVVVLLGFGVIGITAAWMIMAGLVVALDAYWVRRLLPVDLRTGLRRIVRIVRESASYWAFGVFFMVYLWIDFVMLSLMTSAEVVGWYGVPMRLFQTLMFLPVVVSTAWLPRFVASFADGPDELHRTARAPVELVLLLSLPIAAATVLAAQPVIQFLYGSSYDDSVTVLMILGVCIPPMYLNIMLSQVLIAMKRLVVWTWVMAGATVVNPLFNLVLIPATDNRFDNGAIGAATSLFLTELLVVSAGLVMVGRLVFDRRTVRRVVLGTAAAVATCGVGYEARALGAIPSLAAGGLTFVVLAAVLRVFTADELALMKTSVNKVVQRVPVLKRLAPTVSDGGGGHPLA